MLHASKLAGRPPGECLYIGDAERDIEAGRLAGMKTLVALFGYIGSGDQPETWGADGMIRTPQFSTGSTDMDIKLLIVTAFFALLGGGLGWLIAMLRGQKRIAELSTALDLERRHAAVRVPEIEKAIAVLANQALRQNSQSFLQLAQENLKQFQVQAKSDLDQKEKAVEQLVRPIREALEKTEQQVRLMEKERKEAYGALHKHLESMTQTQLLLQGETRNLVQALRRPEVRGQWGEMTLKRLTELAGMVEHCDFYTQETVSGEDGKMRPDMVVRMPDGREIVVDVKTPLDAYLSAVLIAQIPEVKVPFTPMHETAGHLMPVLLPAALNRQGIMDDLRNAGIQSSIHYPPIHHFSYYRERFPGIQLPKTEEFCARELTLPLHPSLTKEDVTFIGEALRKAVHENT